MVFEGLDLVVAGGQEDAGVVGDLGLVEALDVGVFVSWLEAGPLEADQRGAGVLRVLADAGGEGVGGVDDVGDAGVGCT